MDKKTSVRFFTFSAFHVLLIFVLITLLSSVMRAETTIQSSKNKKPFPVRYISDVDSKTLIKTVTLAPVYDNVNSIYAEPIQKLLVEILQADKMWGYVEFPKVDQKLFVETYDSKPEDVLKILDQTKSQGLMTAFITKGPKGLNAKLKLYTQDQGMIFGEETFQDLKTFEIEKIREEFVTLYHNLKNKLPYQGYVLSRRGLDVTLNIGEKNGVKVGDEVSIAQILKLIRHPKLKTLVGVEKEILGKVQITKVEPYLSFGQIIFEKETGVIEIGTKTVPVDFIAYPRPVVDPKGIVVGDRKIKISPKNSTLTKKLNSNLVTETEATTDSTDNDASTD